MLNPSLSFVLSMEPATFVCGLLAAVLATALGFSLRMVARLRRDVREGEAKFHMVVETMQEGVLIRDGQGEIVVANAQGVEILGLSVDQLNGRSSAHPTWLAIRENGQTWPREEWPSHVALRDGKPQRDRVMGVRTAWGETIWLSVNAVPLFRTGEPHPYLVVTTFSDVTVRKRREDRTRRQIERAEDANAELAEANARLADMALTDGLTGLRNHRAFKERLVAEVERSRRDGSPLSLILLDVDEFKSYNDRFGHLEGDEALKMVARVLMSGARATDLVARYGGEEFAILLPDADERAAFAIAERFRAAVQAATWEKRAVTASFGVATLFDEDEPERLIAEADAALYRSKGAGRNQVKHASGCDEDRFLFA